MQEPSSYVSEYTAPATLITSSCKIAKNTTDGWTKTLYSAGDPVTYASWEEFMYATANGTATPVFSPSVRQITLSPGADIHVAAGLRVMLEVATSPFSSASQLHTAYTCPCHVKQELPTSAVEIAHVVQRDRVMVFQSSLEGT